MSCAKKQSGKKKQMKIKFLLLMSLILASVNWNPAKAQTPEQLPEQTARLHVIVQWDNDHDGQEEGVGQGVPVTVRESASIQEFLGYTNRFSTASFVVDRRTYIVKAYPPQTRLFFVWICTDQELVDQDTEYLILHCVERFFLWNPFVLNGRATK